MQLFCLPVYLLAVRVVLMLILFPNLHPGSCYTGLRARPMDGWAACAIRHGVRVRVLRYYADVLLLILFFIPSLLRSVLNCE